MNTTVFVISNNSNNCPRMLAHESELSIKDDYKGKVKMTKALMNKLCLL